MKQFIIFIILIVSGYSVTAQTCNNETVISLKQAGIGEDVIIQKINSSECEFDTSAEALIQLKNQDVSDELISTMIESNTYSDEIINLSSIQDLGNKLVVNEKNEITKGSSLQILLPASRDFVFVQKKKSKISAAIVGAAADVVGSGAAAVGMGTGNVKVMKGAIKVMKGAGAVEYGANAMERINELDISSEAKAIAGKTAEIIEWGFSEETGYVLLVRIDKKKYEVNLQEALMANEISLIP